MSTVAPAVASPLGQLEPEERLVPPAAFDAVLAALAGRPDEVAAQTLSGRRTSCKIAWTRCCWTPSTTCWAPWW